MPIVTQATILGYVVVCNQVVARLLRQMPVVFGSNHSRLHECLMKLIWAFRNDTAAVISSFEQSQSLGLQGSGQWSAVSER